MNGQTSLDLTRFAARRAQLTTKVQGPILLLGNGERSRNLPMNKVPFRQDSTFLYFTGCSTPGAAAVLDDDGFTLLLPEPADDDALWHGVVPSLGAQGRTFGAQHVAPRSTLSSLIGGRRVSTLAVADENTNREIQALTGTSLSFGVQHGDECLMDAVIDMRRAKDGAELDQMRAAARHTEAAFEAVMTATRAGSHERTLNALFEGVLAARGCTTGYQTILTQAGEVLHNHGHNEPLTPGRLVLLDGGGEVPSGYGVDITRTWPVSGRFEGRQKAAYEAVLAAQLAAIDVARIGVQNRAVHDAASRVLAQWLRDEGLLLVDPDTSVETGAHAAFFPHGVGHHLGLDVHDLENFGDRSSYPPGVVRPDLFGTAYLRMDLPLEQDWVITVEPGFYVVPAIIEDPTLARHFNGLVDLDRAREWYGFGGIRIEDDVHVTPDGPVVLTQVPKTVRDLESIVGTGPSAEERLCCT